MRLNVNLRAMTLEDMEGKMHRSRPGYIQWPHCRHCHTAAPPPRLAEAPSPTLCEDQGPLCVLQCEGVVFSEPQARTYR